MWYYRINKWRMVAVIALVCLVATALVTFLHVNAVPDEVIQISLNGDSVICLALGQEFTDPGAVALLGKEDIQQIPVIGVGTVNTDQLGDYYIKYKFGYNEQVVTTYRCIRVADMTAPSIQLVADEQYYTMPGQPYVEEGFTATDDVDGDITHRVHRSEHDGKVTYAVSDLSGNRTVIERKIRYKDEVAPTITIQGDYLVSLTAGQAYQEPGYVAKDNLEGDITADVTVVGSVDTKTAGVYILKYQVKDGYGNLGTAERIVRVIPQEGLGAVQPNGKIIYLTFDDGPSAHTDRLLDILAQYNVKATFFVVKTGMIGTVERIAKEGHTVAIHSVSHSYRKIYANEEAFFNDVYSMQSVIEKHTGQKPMMLRFPGGSSNTVSRRYNKGIMTRLTQQVKEQGFRYFDWNVDSMDAGGAKTAEEVLNNVINGIGEKSVSVVLQHDLYGFSVDAVEQIITWGLENGYTFAPLTMDSPACEHDPNN